MKVEGVKTYITNGLHILFQILALTGVVDVDMDTQIAVAGGFLAIAGIFQRMGTKKAEKAALEAANKTPTISPPVHPTSAYRG